MGSTCSTESSAAKTLTPARLPPTLPLSPVPLIVPPGLPGEGIPPTEPLRPRSAARAVSSLICIPAPGLRPMSESTSEMPLPLALGPRLSTSPIGAPLSEGPRSM